MSLVANESGPVMLAVLEKTMMVSFPPWSLTVIWLALMLRGVKGEKQWVQGWKTFAEVEV